MARTDIIDRVFGDLRLALGLLTRLPLPGTPDMTRGAAAAWAWPVAGLAAGVIGALAIWLTSALPAGVAAALGLAAMIMVTGAMHEDGLADSADGLWGGWDRDRRLTIMKDSRIGAYGVIALILSLLARWSLLATLIGAGVVFAPLIAAAMLSRVPMIFLMALMDPARPGGLAGRVGQPPLAAALIAAGLALLAALILSGGAAIWAMGLALVLTLGLALVAQAKIGGQTGDILGASQQISEISALGVLAAYLI